MVNRFYFQLLFLFLGCVVITSLLSYPIYGYPVYGISDMIRSGMKPFLPIAILLIAIRYARHYSQENSTGLNGRTGGNKGWYCTLGGLIGLVLTYLPCHGSDICDSEQFLILPALAGIASLFVAFFLFLPSVRPGGKNTERLGLALVCAILIATVAYWLFIPIH